MQPHGKANRQRVAKALGLTERTLAQKLGEENTSYEKVVDRLLSSPHFGERMAIHWLDLVRFADSAGYHSDNHRELWLYRDRCGRWFVHGVFS